jgi:hypothetical protein
VRRGRGAGNQDEAGSGKFWWRGRMWEGAEWTGEGKLAGSKQREGDSPWPCKRSDSSRLSKRAKVQSPRGWEGLGRYRGPG